MVSVWLVKIFRDGSHPYMSLHFLLVASLQLVISYIELLGKYILR